MDKISALDRHLDYVPFVSTVTNLFDLFCKHVVIPKLDTKNHFFTYLKNKNDFRCVALLIPVIGNVIVYLYDKYIALKTVEEGLKAWLKNDKIEGIKEEAAKRIINAAKHGLPALDLSHLNLSKLFPEIRLLTGLTFLNLSFNSITSLPKEIISLSKLSELYLSSNQLTKLPTTIGLLTNLTVLDIGHNHFLYLPTEIGKLTNLTKLSLKGNVVPYQNNLLKRIVYNCLWGDEFHFPAEIGQLTQLSELELGCKKLPNHITKLTSLTVLNLNLSSLPLEITRFTKLSKLILHNSEIKTLPGEIGELRTLSQLILTANQLESLPAAVSSLTNLRILSLGKNRLTSLPAQIGYLTGLTELNIGQNKITLLPAEIGRLTGLKELNAAENGLKTLPAEVGHLTSLKILNLERNDLRALPGELGQMIKLETLNLSLNPNLRRMPLSLGQIISLTSILFSGTKITEANHEPIKNERLKRERIQQAEKTGILDTTGLFPKEIFPDIFRLTNLTELRLSAMNLTLLPTEIGLLTNLTLLELSDNSLTALPTEIGLLTKLTSFNVKKNLLKLLPTEIGLLTNLTKLTLLSNQLSELPTEIAALSKLNDLYINENQLGSLPTEIGLLTNLVVLNLTINRLRTLPTEIGLLTHLTDLYLDFNRLVSLPTEIGLLTSLKILYLNSNRIDHFPTVDGLTSLTELYFGANNLTRVPQTLWKLTSLTVLSVYNNEIETIPDGIGNLKKLKELNVSNNGRLRTLPRVLDQIPSLNNIIINDTLIPGGLVSSILYQCHIKQDSIELKNLPARLENWQANAFFTDKMVKVALLPDDLKIILHEWLIRLEKIKDYTDNLPTLAKAVCNILADVFKNDEFQDFFFNQALVNNVSCTDRTAMSFNEIYTRWNIMCRSVSLSLKEKLKLLMQAATTIRLRKELQKLINQREREMKRRSASYEGEYESVEIFLYYEARLGKKLDLLSIIENVAFGHVGACEWIDQNALVKTVKENYLDDLFEMPQFEKMLLQDAAVKEEWDEINNEYNLQLEELGDIPEGSSTSDQVLNYQFRQGKIMQEQRKEKTDLARKWVKKLFTE